MRLALLLLIATSASAQTPDSTAAPRSVDLLVIGGLGGGAAAVTAGGFALREFARSDDQSAAFLLYPVGVLVGVYGMGRLTGRDGSLVATAGGAALGAAVAGGGILAVGYGFSRAFRHREDVIAYVTTFGGLAAIVAAPLYFTVKGFAGSEAHPVVFVGPDGERTAGVALRVGL